MNTAERPWNAIVRVNDVPETGRHLELTAGAEMCAALAQPAGVDAIERLSAAFDLARRGRDGLHVSGRVSATVRQTCVVSLEPVVNEIDEPVDVVYAPTQNTGTEAAEEVVSATEDVEPLAGNSVDLGVLATEFLILGVDPYPRKAEAAFEPPKAPAGSQPHPFAALAALKKGTGKD